MLMVMLIFFFLFPFRVDQTRFEVNVSMPAFFQNTDSHIRGSVMAKYVVCTFLMCLRRL